MSEIFFVSTSDLPQDKNFSRQIITSLLRFKTVSETVELSAPMKKKG